jgi:hypothetical protein
MSKPLGRIVPPDFEHVEKYPLSALPTAETPTDVPVPIGVNWYTSFDTPKQRPDGSWHLPDVEKGEDLGTVRGGHGPCLEPMGAVKKNRTAVWKFYNQGEEGACVGFGHSHAQTILHGATYDAFWLYDEARRLEGKYPAGEGTTCRAAADVLRTIGLRASTAEVCERGVDDGPVEASLGITAIRWATTAEEVCAALARPNAAALPLVNSWGENYPEVVWLPVATLARLLAEEGEAGVYTER